MLALKNKLMSCHSSTQGPNSSFGSDTSLSAGKGKRNRTREKLSLNNALTKALMHRAAVSLHTHNTECCHCPQLATFELASSFFEKHRTKAVTLREKTFKNNKSCNQEGNIWAWRLCLTPTPDLRLVSEVSFKTKTHSLLECTVWRLWR